MTSIANRFADQRDGAPDRNKNAAKHGLYMPGTRLPRGCGRIRARLILLEQQLEAEIRLRHTGEISLYQAAVIQSCVRHEKQAQLAERWLREGPSLDVTDRTQLLRIIGQATTSRDKCLQQLGLDKEFKENRWQSLTESARDGSQRDDGQPESVSGVAAD